MLNMLLYSYNIHNLLYMLDIAHLHPEYSQDNKYYTMCHLCSLGSWLGMIRTDLHLWYSNDLNNLYMFHSMSIAHNLMGIVSISMYMCYIRTLPYKLDIGYLYNLNMFVEGMAGLVGRSHSTNLMCSSLNILDIEFGLRSLRRIVGSIVGLLGNHYKYMGMGNSDNLELNRIANMISLRVLTRLRFLGDMAFL